MMAKKLRSGDVLEVRLPEGFGYLLYLGQHPEYGDAVTVSSSYRQRPSVIEALFDGGYVALYPARAAVTQGLVELVGNAPARPVPRALRRAGVRSGRTVETWIIEDGSGETIKRNLSQHERRIPIAAIWNHEILVQRIVEGWRPEMEG